MSAMTATSIRTPGKATADPWDTRTAVVRRVVEETPDTSTFWMTLLDPAARDAYRFEPGQFNMLYLFGVGEVPISISSDPAEPHRLAHTIRSVGRVTNPFRGVSPGTRLGMRGPFGRGWPVDVARGGDLLIVAGGLGMAPVRPVVYKAARERSSFGRVILLVGARSPDQMLYRREFDAWRPWIRERGIEVGLTVDVPDDAWPYGSGVASTLFEPARIDPHRTTAFVCGPEIMMRFAARDLLRLGMPANRLFVSMERNMQCGIRQCGHCQLGQLFVCADGPVFRWDRIEPLMEVPEL